MEWRTGKKAWIVLLKGEVSYWLTLPFRSASVPFPLCPPHFHPAPHILDHCCSALPILAWLRGILFYKKVLKAMKMNYKRESSFASSDAEIFFF